MSRISEWLAVPLGQLLGEKCRSTTRPKELVHHRDPCISPQEPRTHLDIPPDAEAIEALATELGGLAVPLDITAEDAAVAAAEVLRRRVLQATVIRGGGRTRIASRW